MIATGVLLLAAGAGSSMLLIPTSDAADATSTELERAQSQVGRLRAQLANGATRAPPRRRERPTPRHRRRTVERQPCAARRRVDVRGTARLRRLATCESTLNPTARNGRYLGLFQFGAPLWRTTPHAKFSRTDPYAAALAAAWAFKRGMASHWPLCGRR